MSKHQINKKITVTQLLSYKNSGQKIAMLTAYDYTFAKILDQSGIDIILVGDSAANVMAGYETTLPISLDQMIYHGASVVRAVKNAFVVVDMPFGSYQISQEIALQSAVRIMKETGADAIKLEGAGRHLSTIRSLVEMGIPVVGHLGLTPQSVHTFGGYGLRAKDEVEAQRLRSDVVALRDAGCSLIVLEKIPAMLAKEMSELVDIPIIGIGAGPYVDGQVLVLQDMLGMNQDFKPKFLRQFAHLHETITSAVEEYIDVVKSGVFPNDKESY